MLDPHPQEMSTDPQPCRGFFFDKSNLSSLNFYELTNNSATVSTCEFFIEVLHRWPSHQHVRVSVCKVGFVSRAAPQRTQVRVDRLVRAAAHPGRVEHQAKAGL